MNFIPRVKALISRIRIHFTPGQTAWHAATLTILVGWFLLLLTLSWKILVFDFTIWKVIGFSVVYFAVLIAGLVAYLAVTILVRMPRKFVFGVIAFLPLLPVVIGEFGMIASLVMVVGGIICLTLTAGSLASLGANRLTKVALKNQKVTLGLLASSSVSLGFIFFISFIAYEEPNPEFSNYVLQDRTLALADPSLTGDYEVLTTSYGSGTDKHRPEYAEAVGFQSTTVDGSKLIDNWENVIGWSRTGFWGFDASELPIQARVWYPSGSGNHPLVLVVHGNHSMEDFSDPGYDYLGELLASRGYIVASIDENFLNSSIGDLINPIAGGLREENDARGWVLLKHLQQWQQWNSSHDHLFANRVDMENISLIGHSRGGEAVAIASHFNQLSHYPDDGSVVFDFGFSIKGVIAIAPVDGQYEPRNFPTPMSGSNYFVIHGSTDADVTSFAGIRQFNRAELANPEQFKAALYVLGANHGQFNSSWGKSDTILGWSLRKNSIIPEAEQQKIAEVYFSAFLEIVHRGTTGYLPLFQNAEYAAAWLPDTYYINNFQQLETQWLANFEEDSDLSTASFDNLKIKTNGLSKWREEWLGLKYNVLHSHVLALAWDERFSSDASLSLEFNQTVNLSNYENLIFTAAQNTDSSLPTDFETDDLEEENAEDEESLLLDWSVVLVDNNGSTASLLLSHDEALYPQIKANTLKAQYSYGNPQSEAVMKYFSFPLNQFVADNLGFNMNQVSAIRFVFDQSQKGSILLDDIGLK